MIFSFPFILVPVLPHKTLVNVYDFVSLDHRQPSKVVLQVYLGTLNYHEPITPTYSDSANGIAYLF